MQRAPASPSAGAAPAGLEDLTLLPDLTEEHINRNLRLRFEQSLIYTDIGNVLLSVNPYQPIPFLYDDELVEFYRNGGKERSLTNVLALQRRMSGKLEQFERQRRLRGGSAGRGPGRENAFLYLNGGPHLFKLANNMYTALLNEEESQSVIISGESGAGKTEASKQIIHFISYVSEAARARGAGEPQSETTERGGVGGGDTIDRIKRIILESNPLLEAFGNAKTVKNDNSSRFGKFLEIFFDKRSDAGRPDAARGGRHGLPTGGHVRIFLLEKSRVVRQQTGERNFHIFYQLISGADPATRARLRLDRFDRATGGRPAFFRLLCGGGTTRIDNVDDAAEFAKTLRAMEEVGISTEVQMMVFELLAAILHLGEIQFTEMGEDSSGGVSGSGAVKCGVSQREELEFVASLLKISDALALEKALTVKKLEIGERTFGAGGGRTQVLEVPLDLMECGLNRDAAAKLLYESLFHYIVFAVNHALESASACATAGSARPTVPMGDRPNGNEDGNDDAHPFAHYAARVEQEMLRGSASAASRGSESNERLMLGVLDIYGFEIFQNNSFEQMCINYINEKLHQIFIDLTLKKEQEEYETEGIALPERVDRYFDNKRILNMIEGTAATANAGGGGTPGIFQLLDDTCVSLAKEPEAVADAKFLEKLDLFLSASDSTRSFFEKSERNGFFAVNHYAGKVTYNVAGFVAKNRDRVSNTVLEVLRGSEHAFLTEILAPTMLEATAAAAAGGGAGSSSSLMYRSAGRKIREQADKLVTTLRSSTIHYIRTIKPNETKTAGVYADDCVRHQIQYLGLMENIKIRKLGFIYRTYFDVFLRRFSLLFSLLNECLRQRRYQLPGAAQTAGDAAPWEQPTEAFNHVDHEDRDACAVLLAFVEDYVRRLQGPAALPAAAPAQRLVFEHGCWQLGESKVFLRQPAHLTTLEKLRERCVSVKVCRIQRAFRAYCSERTNRRLKQRVSRVYERAGKVRRADSAFRPFLGDYLNVKSSDSFFRRNGRRNRLSMLRLLSYDPAAAGWREVSADEQTPGTVGSADAAAARPYYANVLTGEVQWAKPRSMLEMEANQMLPPASRCAAAKDSTGLVGATLADALAAVGGGGEESAEELINTDGLHIVFSAKAERMVLFDDDAAAATTAPGESALRCTFEEVIVVLTDKALCLFKEVDEPAAASNDAPARARAKGKSRADRHGASSATAEAPPSPPTTTSSRILLLKRLDLHVLAGVTVSALADEFLYVHAYPSQGPCRPVFSTQRSSDGAAAAAHNSRHKTRRAKAAKVFCECCGQLLQPAAQRACCPCCGRVCCVRQCMAAAAAPPLVDPAALPLSLRPLPTLLGTNVVNAAAVQAVRQRAQKNSGEAVGGTDQQRTATILARRRLMESVAVCPLCVDLEPQEPCEDVVFKTFLRTELAAHLLKAYKARTGLSLSLTVAPSASSGAQGAGLQVCLADNEALRAHLRDASAARKAGSTANHRSRNNGGGSSVHAPFASYRILHVLCMEGDDDVNTDTSASRMTVRLSTAEPSAAATELCAIAPAGLPPAVLATVAARREERRVANEKRRREEEAVVRARAAAKEQAREDNYARIVEEKKRLRREQAAAARQEQMLQEELGRQRREAGAMAVAEKARRPMQ